MNVFTKVLVVLVLLLSAAFAGSQMALHSRRVKYQALYAEKAAEVTLKEQKVTDLQAERDDLARERDTLNQRLVDEGAGRRADRAQLEEQIKDLRSALNKSEDALSAAGLRIDTMVGVLDKQVEHIGQVEQANYALKEAVRVADARIKALEDDVRARDGSIKGLEARVARLVAEMRDVTTDRDYLANAVAEAKAKGFDVLLEDVPIIDAKVLDVDPTISAVVLNKGSDDAVKMNFPFTISRGLEYVAKVTVVEVHPELSVARVVPGFEEKPIKVGDDASTRR